MSKVKMIDYLQFNCRVAEGVFKPALKNGWTIYEIMLKCNDAYAYTTKGKYPEKDEDWIECLCLENLRLLEDWAWEQFPPEVKEAQDLLAYMSICELSAPKAESLTKESKMFN